MTERPILFSGPMVRAILEGRKTQTRRAIMPQPPASAVDYGVVHSHTIENYAITFLDGPLEDDNTSAVSNIHKCPAGQIGGHLWVRETWAKTFCLGKEMVVFDACDNRTDYGGPWKPSIHMRREYSRITLEVTNIRVERLQDISEADAMAEGVEYFTQTIDCDPCPRPQVGYRYLWEKINGRDSWHKNPWVWVIEFKRVETKR